MRTALVYFNANKENGYGACFEDRFEKRIKAQKLLLEQTKVIRRGLSVEEAGILERELQIKNGYPIDPKPFSHMVFNGQVRSKTPKALKKLKERVNEEGVQKQRVQNTNYDLRNSSINAPSIKAFKCKYKQGLGIFEYKKYIGTFESVNKAAKKLNLDPAAIYGVLYPHFPAKSSKGYTFEYA